MSVFGPGPLFEQNDEHDPFKPGRDHVKNLHNQSMNPLEAKQYVKFNTKPPEMVCDICKETEVLELPISFSEMEVELRRFKADHEGCE